VERTPPRLNEGPAPADARRRAYAGGSSVLLYVETWLPLLIMSLTVAILFGVAAFIMGRAGT
jgi:hypothetical protein